MICIICMFNTFKLDFICLLCRFCDDVITGQDDVISISPSVAFKFVSWTFSKKNRFEPPAPGEAVELLDWGHVFNFQMRKNRPKRTLTGHPNTVSYQVEYAESDEHVSFFQQRSRKILKTKVESYHLIWTLQNSNKIDVSRNKSHESPQKPIIYGP